MRDLNSRAPDGRGAPRPAVTSCLRLVLKSHLAPPVIDFLLREPAISAGESDRLDQTLVCPCSKCPCGYSKLSCGLADGEQFRTLLWFRHCRRLPPLLHDQSTRNNGDSTKLNVMLLTFGARHCKLWAV